MAPPVEKPRARTNYSPASSDDLKKSPAQEWHWIHQSRDVNHRVPTSVGCEIRGISIRLLHDIAAVEIGTQDEVHAATESAACIYDVERRTRPGTLAEPTRCRGQDASKADEADGRLRRPEPIHGPSTA